MWLANGGGLQVQSALVEKIQHFIGINTFRIPKLAATASVDAIACLTKCAQSEEMIRCSQHCNNGSNERWQDYGNGSDKMLAILWKWFRYYVTKFMEMVLIRCWQCYGNCSNERWLPGWEGKGGAKWTCCNNDAKCYSLIKSLDISHTSPQLGCVWGFLLGFELYFSGGSFPPRLPKEKSFS